MSPRLLTPGSVRPYPPRLISFLILLPLAISSGRSEDVIASNDGADTALGAAKSEPRILGVIPNYQTVSDPDRAVPALTGREKWALFARGAAGPYNLVTAVLGGTPSQMRLGIPNYGPGGGAYGERIGAALADMTTQSMFSGAVLATLLHQDPRYFRRGPQLVFSVRHRTRHRNVQRLLSRPQPSSGCDAAADRIEHCGLRAWESAA